jgi:hypothetical protein
VNKSYDTLTSNKGSYNTNTKTNTSTKTNASTNASYDTLTANKGSYNTNTKTNSSTNGSYNSKVEGSYNTKTTTDSNNTSWTITASVSNEDLSATVTGTPVSFNGGGSLTTGQVGFSGSSYSGFAGIQTTSINTGLGSVNQAATALSANADITFH